VFAAANLPTITASATNPALSQNGWKTFHRILAGDPIQGAGLAKFILVTLKGAKVFVIDDASTYGAGLAGIVKTALGAAAVGSDTIDPKGSDYNAAVTKAKDAGADVVFFGGYYDAAGKLAKQLADGGVKATFVSGDGTKDPGFIKSGGAATEGAYVSCTCADASALPGGADFVTAYKAKFNSDAGTYAAEAFDAANFFLAGIVAGKQDRASLNDYVSSSSYQGITKLVKFDATGEVQATDVFMYQVKSGVLVGIGKV
jgi:branched-chain amino acid transport system substrate-binding protein